MDAIPFDQAWALFTNGAPAIFAAHNCEFEQGYLVAPPGTQWICTLKCSLRAWPDAPATGNQVLRYHHKFDAYEGFDRALASRAHRAEPDAYVTAYLVHKLLSVHGIDAPSGMDQGTEVISNYWVRKTSWIKMG